MIPVNHAEVKVKSNVRATMACVGPFWMLPVRRSNHVKAGRIA
jgi:hypothetical protein